MFGGEHPWDLRFQDRQDPRRLNVGATFKTCFAVSQTVGVGEMYLKCFSWLDTFENEGKAAKDGEWHPQKLTRMRWKLKLFFKIFALLGNTPADLYSLELTRLVQ